MPEGEASHGVQHARTAPGALTESDEDLLQRCREADQGAWRELVNRHTRRVFNLAYRFVGRVHEAEDLTQEVFVKVYQSLDRYHSSAGAFSTWLATVTRNHAIDHYRRHREESLRRTHGEDVIAAIPSKEENPLGALERDEQVRLVHQGLRALPPDLREPIVLCDLQGVSYEEAAGILEIPLGTVKSRLNRGRLELAKRLLARRNRQDESMGRIR
jgi:RNA polymerase sigma-70 factor (ECF subfamily)